MKKRMFLLLFLLLTIFCVTPVLADDVEYRILNYNGELQLHSDNTATFTQTVVYDFDSDYNGQYVTLGEAGKMPVGFAVQSSPQVIAEKNGQKNTVRLEEERLHDGYRLKIYNAGQSGDRVKLQIEWKLEQLLWPFEDIAQLNWVPISDWDQDLEDVHLKVTGLGNAGELYVHTRYFSKPAQIRKIENGYEVDAGRVGKGQKLELFAYFPISYLDDELSGSELGLPSFKEQQASVEKDHASHQWVLYQVLPSTLTIGLVLAGVAYLTFRAIARPNRPFDKNARLYEAPSDLSPLLVADYVFSVDFKEMDPTNPQPKLEIDFQKAVQATLLDLIDRGNIKLINQDETPVLEIVHKDGLSTAEYQFLSMAFGSSRSLRIQDLFGDYQISESLYKGASRSRESAIRQKGQSIKKAFSSRVKNIYGAVQAEIHKKGLADLYRPLTSIEYLLFYLSAILYSLVLVVGVLAFAYSWYYGVAVMMLLYGVLTVTALSFLYITWQKSLLLRRDGVLKDEGVETYYLWHSFRNMLRDIARLDKAEIESIVLWNRLLVYAALFGYAERVSEIMKIRRITLPNEDLNLYVGMGWNSTFYHSSHTFASYGEIANTASNFSVSSSGSSGGGFSGGGGGGGGGAF